jgi:hypothetical protein
VRDKKMGIFSSKQKISTEDFCRNFYEQFVFAPELRGVTLWNVMCETDYKLIADADPHFRKVDIDDWKLEMQALYLEVVALAWLHNLKDKFAPIQSDFTKHYLEEKGVDDVWQLMGDYNQAIARASASGYNPNHRIGRAGITMLNLTRVSLAKEWNQLGYSLDAIGRAANRFGSQAVWRAVLTSLSFTLTKRLEYEANDEARLIIIAIIQGFYDGASEAIKGVKIVS